MNNIRFAATRRGALLSLLLTLLFTHTTFAQSDDFNDGTDAGWTRYDPIGAFGYPASYSFPHGGYHILAPGTGDPFVGGGRAGSLREDQSYSSFRAAVDVTDLDPSHPQAVGLFARVNDPGLLTTAGYALTFNPQARTLNLFRVKQEVLIPITSTALPAGQSDTFRLVFTGVGPSLAGQIFGANRQTPLASLSAIDRTSATGINGLLVEDTGDGNHGAAATFDNYAATAIDHFPGDANLDGTVDFKDLLALSQHYGLTTGAALAEGDFDANGTVDFTDLTILAQNYGGEAAPPAAVTPVPEPSVIGLLAFCGVIFRRRRALLGSQMAPAVMIGNGRRQIGRHRGGSQR